MFENLPMTKKIIFLMVIIISHIPKKMNKKTIQQNLINYPLVIWKPYLSKVMLWSKAKVNKTYHWYSRAEFLIHFYCYLLTSLELPFPVEFWNKQNGEKYFWNKFGSLWLLVICNNVETSQLTKKVYTVIVDLEFL